MSITEQKARESDSRLSSRIGRILFLTVSSSMLVSLTSSMVLLTSFILHEVAVDSTLLVAVFALTFAVYVFDRAVKQKEDLVNNPDRSGLFMDRRGFWITVGLASLVISAALGAREGPNVLITLLSPLVVYVAYSIGVPLMPRLKDIPAVKNVVLALTWALIPTLLPNLSVGAPGGERLLPSVLIFYFIFTKIVVNSVLFDVRDIRGDSAAGVKTLAVVFGVKAVRRLLLFVNATLVIWIATCALLGLFVQYIPLLVASMLYGFWHIHFFTGGANRHILLLDVLVDGEWVPLATLILIIHLSS